MPAALRRVGAKITLRKSGNTFVPTLLVNVCPSLSSFWRCPSTRWPKISWKKTPAARPEKIAGPTKGSASGALSSLETSLATRSMAARTIFSSGRPDSSTASNVSNELTSVPSAALAVALMTMRAKPRPWAGGAPGEDRRPDEGLGLGGLEQFGDVVGHAVDGRQDDLFIRQTRFIHRLKCFKRADVGAVGGFETFE